MSSKKPDPDKPQSEADEQTNKQLVQSIRLSNSINEAMEMSSQSFNNQKFILEHSIERYGRLSKLNRTSQQLIKKLKKG